MSDYRSYLDLISETDLERGDIVNVSSDILRLICVCRENGEKFDPNLFIDTILEKVGPEGSVLFPTYTWNFCRGEGFDYRNSPSQTGGLSNIALKRKDFRRTWHPIYSYAVWGRDQDYLVNLRNLSSFSEDSPFGYFYHKQAKNLFIGIDFKLACAFVHYAEERVGVPFRYFKDFSGSYIDETGSPSSATARMYVRDMKLKVNTEIHPRIDSVLFERGYYKKWTLNGIYFGLIDLHGTGDVMIEDLESKGGLVYARPVD